MPIFLIFLIEKLPALLLMQGNVGEDDDNDDDDDEDDDEDDRDDDDDNGEATIASGAWGDVGERSGSAALLLPQRNGMKPMEMVMMTTTRRRRRRRRRRCEYILVEAFL